jgi:DNA-directed RNA polymerase subunit RPC12/RpoP
MVHYNYWCPTCRSPVDGNYIEGEKEIDLHFVCKYCKSILKITDKNIELVVEKIN